MKYVIASASGYGNAGDDLIALALESMVLTIDPAAKLKLTRPPYEEQLIKWADAVIVGGGGLLYDYDQIKSNVANYASYIEHAAELGKPVYVIGVGEQGIFSAAGKAHYRRALDQALLITVRSQEDQKVLREVVGTKTPVLAAQDLVFAASYFNQKPKLSFASKLPWYKPRLGLSLPRLTNQGLDLDAFDKTTQAALTRYDAYLSGPAIAALKQGFRVTLISQSRDDADFYRDLSVQHKLPLVYPELLEAAPSLIDAYQRCDLIVTGRFHGLILGALLGKPTLAVGIKGQKLDKLISERLSSLKGSFYYLDQFVGQDVLANLKKLYEQDKIHVADPKEVVVCRRLAMLNRYLLEAALLNDFGSHLVKSN